MNINTHPINLTPELLNSQGNLVSHQIERCLQDKSFDLPIQVQHVLSNSKLIIDSLLILYPNNK